ncbi:16S rRNA (guanine(527)-N(7))-methyltransferase RsmG [candidate division KSB1 bacterium]|nr:16S rRNA (guanine(527)-N(7))-methyltransferase RsmG [candidate division KSB1 bacterium]
MSNKKASQPVSELVQILPESFKLDASQLELLNAYIDLILKWNSKVRLISSADESRIVKRHIVESLVLVSINRIAPDAEVLDLGAGAGLPGIPLKIAIPSLRMTLLDSRRMKSLFLEEAVKSLRLSDTQVVHDRAEKIVEKFSGKFDCVVARAVSSLYNLWQWSSPVLKNGGALLAQKGGELSKEMEELLTAYPNLQTEKLEYDPAWQVEPSRFVIAIKKETP